jgi:hypothetical protein
LLAVAAFGIALALSPTEPAAAAEGDVGVQRTRVVTREVVTREVVTRRRVVKRRIVTRPGVILRRYAAPSYRVVPGPYWAGAAYHYDPYYYPGPYYYRPYYYPPAPFPFFPLLW